MTRRHIASWERERCPRADLQSAPGRLGHHVSRHYDRGGRCIPGLEQAKADPPVQTTSQEAWPEAEPLGWNNSLGESRGGTPSNERAFDGRREPHRKMRRWLPCVCRRSASFIHFFVARVERSETRERRRSRTFVPGFRRAQSGLRNHVYGRPKDRPHPCPFH